MGAGNTLTTNYVVATTVEGLRQVQELAVAMKTVQEIARSQKTHTVKIHFDVSDTRGVSDVLKDIAVRAGAQFGEEIQKGAKRGRGGSTGTSSSFNGSDAAQFKNLIRGMGTLLARLERQAGQPAARAGGSNLTGVEHQFSEFARIVQQKLIDPISNIDWSKVARGGGGGGGASRGRQAAKEIDDNYIVPVAKSAARAKELVQQLRDARALMTPASDLLARLKGFEDLNLSSREGQREGLLGLLNKQIGANPGQFNAVRQQLQRVRSLTKDVEVLQSQIDQGLQGAALRSTRNKLRARQNERARAVDTLLGTTASRLEESGVTVPHEVAVGERRLRRLGGQYRDLSFLGGAGVVTSYDDLLEKTEAVELGRRQRSSAARGGVKDEEHLRKLLTRVQRLQNAPLTDDTRGLLDVAQAKVAPTFDPKHPLHAQALAISKELNLIVGGSGPTAEDKFAAVEKNLRAVEKVDLSRIVLQFEQMAKWAQEMNEPLSQLNRAMSKLGTYDKSLGRFAAMDSEQEKTAREQLRGKSREEAAAIQAAGRVAAQDLRNQLPNLGAQAAKETASARAAASKARYDAETEAKKAQRDDADARRAAREAVRITQSKGLANAILGAGGKSPLVDYNAGQRVMEELFRSVKEVGGLQRQFHQGMTDIGVRESQGFDATSLRRATGGVGLKLVGRQLNTTQLLEQAIAAGGPNGPLADLANPLAKLQKTTQRRQDAEATGDRRSSSQLLNVERKIAGELFNQLKLRLEQIKAQQGQKSLAEDIFTASKRIAIYGGLGFVGYSIASSIRQTVSEVVNLESSLARIQGILRSKSLSERLEIEGAVIKSAQDYGTALDDMVKATTVFAQTGLNAREALSAARASIGAQLGAGIEPGQAQELLIAVRNISEGHILNTEILDRLSRIESTRPVTAQDLAIALQRVGSLASTLQPERIGGTDFADLVIGATSTIVGHTRVSGNQAATALKFILSRLSSPEIANKLQTKFGVKLAADEKGSLRPLQDVLSDIAATYQATKGTNQGQELLQTVAGARQINVAAALFGNFQEALDTAATSSQALGDNQQRVNIQLDTFVAQMARMDGAFVGFMNALLNSTGILEILRSVVLPSATVGIRAASRAPGLAVAAAGAAGVALANYGLNKITSPTGGVVASGLARVGAGEALVGAASLFRLVSIAGLILTALQGGWAIYRHYQDQRERYGFHATDLKLLFDSEVFSGYRNRAADFGLSDKELRGRVGDAARATQQSITKAHPELGPNIFADNAQLYPKAPGLFNEIQRTFLANLKGAIPTFESVGDAAEQMRVALDLLNSSLKISSFILNDQVTKLQEQVAREVGDLTERLGSGIVVGNQYTGRATPLSGQTAAEISLSSLTRGLGKGLLNLPVVDKTGKTVSVFEAALTAANGRLDDFGRGLDQVALQFYRLNNEQTDLYNRVQTTIKQENLKKGVVADETELRRQTIVRLRTTRGGQQTAAVLANQATFDQQIYQNFISTFDQAKRLKAGGVGGLGAIGGTTYGDLIIDSIQRVLRRAERELTKTLSVGEVQDFKKLQQALGNEGYRTKVLALFGKKGATALIQDRLTQALGGFAAEMATIEAVARNFGAAGLGYDAPKERAQASAGLLRTVSGLGPQLRNELLQIRTRLNLNKSFDEPINALADIEGVSGTGAAGGATRKALSDQLSSFYGALPENERLRLEAQLSQYKEVVGVLQSNEDLLLHLDKSDRELLQNSLQSPGAFIGKLPELVPILIRLAGYLDEEVLARERELELIKRANVLRDLDITQAAAIQQLDIGANRRVAEAAFGPSGGRTYGFASAQVERDAAVARAGNARTAKLAEFTRRRAELGARYNDEVRNAEADYQLARRQAGDEYDRKAYELDLNQTIDATVSALNSMQSAVRDATSGFRDLVTDFDKLSKATAGDVLDNVIQGLGDTLFRQVGNLATDAITGPQGLLGQQLQSLFKTGAVLEAELIYQAHVQGIAAGFAVSRGGTAGAFSLSGLGGSASAGTSIPSLGVQYDPVTGQYTTAETSTTLGAAADDINKLAAQFSSEERKAKLKKLGAHIVGQYGGAFIGQAVSPHGSSYASEGAALGTAIGSLIPGGTIIGGLLGGLFGGLFGKKQPKRPPELSSLERIDRNTRETITAIENQTNQLLNLDNRLLNVPASFVVPNYRPLALGIGAGNGGTVVQQAVQVTITDSRDPEATAAAVARVLRQESRQFGTYVSPRR